MKVLRKSLFTLLELLVVLFILSLMAIVTGVKVKEAYEEQRFLAEAEQVLGHLQMAQDLMLILDTGVQFELTRYQDHSLSYRLDVQKPLAVKRAVGGKDEAIDKASSIKWMNIIEREIPLQFIKSFALQEGEFFTLEEQENPKVLEKLRLHFSLARMSSGRLCLSTASTKSQNDGKNTQAYTITLVGYPCQIRNQKNLVKEAERIQESRKLYPKLSEG